jgi:hypothetical protein
VFPLKIFFNILNDLANDQKAMMELIRQFAKNSLEGKMKKNQNGDREFIIEGSHSRTTM